ncbi:MAG: Fe(3+)-transport system permease protein fbpB 2 [Deltaproteobacteria bacterium]|nr:Fe(3+)-transport system permease protein fbpB 2 [Deltaproteobacteria bacterium]
MSATPTTFANNAQIRRWSLARRFSIRALTLGITLAVVSYLVLVPLFMLLYASVKSTEDKLPFESTVTTLGNYAAVFTSPSTLPIFLNTLLFTVGSLAVGLPLAILLAWLLERTAIPARAWIANLILVPMTIPSLLSAIAWIQLLDSHCAVSSASTPIPGRSISIHFMACVSCRDCGWYRPPIS